MGTFIKKLVSLNTDVELEGFLELSLGQLVPLVQLSFLHFPYGRLQENTRCGQLHRASITLLIITDSDPHASNVDHFPTRIFKNDLENFQKLKKRLTMFRIIRNSKKCIHILLIFSKLLFTV